MKKLPFLICCFFLISFATLAQEEIVVDSIATDSLIAETDPPKKAKKSGPIKNFFKKGYPNPKKAMIFSLVIPGAGQLYNKKYWKTPIVVGACGAMIYFIDFSSGQYKYLKKEYIKAVDEDEDTISELIVDKGWTEEDIKSYRDLYRKRMELSYIGLAAVTLLSGVDAFVDAHLMRFDVSEDLTMQVRPKLDIISYDSASLGLGVSLRLSDNREKTPKVFFQ